MSSHLMRVNERSQDTKHAQPSVFTKSDRVIIPTGCAANVNNSKALSRGNS